MGFLVFLMENKMKLDLKSVLIGIIIGILIFVLVGLLINDVHIDIRLGDIDKINNKVDLINN